MTAVAVLLVFVCTLLVHWPALSAKALSVDDNQYLIDNPVVKDPSWNSAKRFLTEVIRPSTVKGYYQPLSMISLMLDSAMGGTQTAPAAFHRTSLALHGANTALMVILLYLLFRNLPAAAMAGLLFGVHPIVVDTIPWISERKTLLATFFALLCVVFYVRRAKGGGRGWYAASFGAMVLALMSKPTSTMLPFCLLLLDYWPLRRLSKRTILEKAPFLLVAIASAAITFYSQKLTAAVRMPEEFSPLRVPYTVCHNIVFYLQKLAWPVAITSHYPAPDPLSASNPAVLAGLIGTVTLVAVLIFSLRWTRAALTGWLIFFVAIFPALGVIGFVHTNAIASNKFAYLPAFGLVIVVGALLDHLWRIGATRRRTISVRSVTVVVVTGLVVLLGAKSRTYMSCWRDTKTLFEHMLVHAPRQGWVRMDYATELKRLGHREESIRQYKQALGDETSGELCRNLSLALLEMGRLDEAMQYARQSLELRPNYSQGHAMLASILKKMGRGAEAINSYNQAIRLDPLNQSAHHNLATELMVGGRIDEAIAHYKKAIELRGDRWEARHGLAIAYSRAGQVDAAIAQCREALRVKPDYAPAASQLARLLTLHKRHDPASRREATRMAELCCELTDYSRPRFLDTLAATHAVEGRYHKAVEFAGKAVAIAESAGQAALAGDIRSRLVLYQQGKSPWGQASGQ